MKNIFIICSWLLLALVMGSCASFRGSRNLDPESKEFFSKVRYIITKEEKKAFISIPPAKRSQYIKEFWARRDPTPGTEVNEFKDRYFRLIEEANRLFREGTTPGWLQDRGRIYIAFGPPDSRETYPRGIDFYGKPTEIWWYGFFPIVFTDENWSGNYTLTPLSSYQISEVARGQAAAKERNAGWGPERVPTIEFAIRSEPKDGQVEFLLDIPYKVIWFKSISNNFVTTLDITLKVSDKEGRTIWERQQSSEISVPREEGLKLFEQNYSLRFEAELKPGEYQLEVEVSNQTGGGKSKRKLAFSL